MSFLTDQPALQDRLSAGRLVDALAGLLFPADGVVTPLVVGVYGSWGSGKSTLLRLLRDRLSSDPAGGPRKVIEFSPWEYRHEPGLLVPLLLTLQRSSGGEVKKQILKIAAITARTAGKQLFSAAVNLVSGGLIEGKEVVDEIQKSLESENDKGVRLELSDLVRRQDLVREVVSEIRQQAGKSKGGSEPAPATLVFLIDDLDRCHPPDRIVELLEQVKLFLHLEGCIFVIACDRDVVVQAIEARFPGQGAGYLDKFVQVPVPLPEPHPEDLRKLMEAACGGGDPDGTDREWLVYWERIAELLDGNPRRVKRLYNEWLLAWEILRNDSTVTGADRFLLAKWLILRELSPALSQNPFRVLDLERTVQETGRIGRTRLEVDFGLPERTGAFLAWDARRRFDTTERLATVTELRRVELAGTRRELERRAESGRPMRDCGVPLAGQTLSYGQFAAADFSGCDLVRTEFTRARLAGANFDGADVREARFDDADLKPEQLRNAKGIDSILPDPLRAQVLDILESSPATAARPD